MTTGSNKRQFGSFSVGRDSHTSSSGDFQRDGSLESIEKMEALSLPQSGWRMNPSPDMQSGVSAWGRGQQQYDVQPLLLGTGASGRQPERAETKRAVDDDPHGARMSRTFGGSPCTKRTSALNVHNYPDQHHPVGIAIWIIQKLDLVRRERSWSISSRESSPHASPLALSPAVSPQFDEEGSELHEGDDLTSRRQAQRERKVKQRLENWAKNKENDVVARAKLDAKKKFGCNPSTKPPVLKDSQVQKPSPSEEKEAYTRRRIRDDFARLMNRQTNGFADILSKLEPFQSGFGQKYFGATGSAYALSTHVRAACRLLVNVLPALGERDVSRTSQLAVNALVQALETKSLSSETFFDAIAVLAEHKEIREGTDHVLGQLFSRSSTSSRLTKALRTSSAAGSSLFATTNGTSVIYNTIEHADMISNSTPQHASPSLTDSHPAPARVSSRERKPTSKMMGISTFSQGSSRRRSTSTRTSPSKAPRMTCSSKLRGCVSFAKSPSPSPKPVGFAADTKSASHDEGVVMSTKNEYRSEQPSPPTGSGPDCSGPQVEVNDKSVQNLFDMALLASHEDSDRSSVSEDHQIKLQHEDAENGTPKSFQSLQTAEHDCPAPMESLHTGASASEGHAQIKGLNASSTASSEHITSFTRMMDKLPSRVSNFKSERSKKTKEVVELYDQIAQTSSFQTAKQLGLLYPEIPRPFVDRDGWKFTGAVDDFGGEIVEVDGKRWVWPQHAAIYGHQPLRRPKRKIQLDEERIYGFPSSSGNDESQAKRPKLDEEMSENVVYEKLMLDIRGAAKHRGLSCDQWLSWNELVEAIKRHDMACDIIGAFEDIPDSPALGTPLDASDGDPGSWQEASEESEDESNDDFDCRSEGQDVQTRAQSATRSSLPAVNRRKVSSQRGRDGPALSPLSDQEQLKAEMPTEHVAVEDPSLAGVGVGVSPLVASDSKSDMRPPTTPGTFNTFNGPIALSQSPTGSPVGTPLFTQFSIINASKHSSISPLPTPPTINTRFPSTVSVAASSPSLSIDSRAPSPQSLDADNVNAYDATKGFSAANTPTQASPTYSFDDHSAGSSTRASSHGLGGGFPGGGFAVNGAEKRVDGRGHRKRSKAPDFKMTVNQPARKAPVTQPRAVRGGEVLKFG